jgi:3D-(3,5/4)-trihydroxycyclohexane-1,2-dione acylhydrolase (decyclizing)
MMANELVTSVQEGRKIVVVLTDNHGYQCIHNLQRGCGGRILWQRVPRPHRAHRPP